MNSNIEKLKTKYLRSVNAINVVGVYSVISTILFFVLKKYSIVQISEAARWSNFLGLHINSNIVEYLGTSISLFINLMLAFGCYLLSKKSKQGDIRFYFSFLVIYVVDSLVSIFYFDIYSFILHLCVIGYLLYGYYMYTKLIVEYEKNKKNKDKRSDENGNTNNN